MGFAEAYIALHMVSAADINVNTPVGCCGAYRHIILGLSSALIEIGVLSSPQPVSRLISNGGLEKLGSVHSVTTRQKANRFAEKSFPAN